jgi:hypothetical protein
LVDGAPKAARISGGFGPYQEHILAVLAEHDRPGRYQRMVGAQRSWNIRRCRRTLSHGSLWWE